MNNRHIAKRFAHGVRATINTADAFIDLMLATVDRLNSLGKSALIDEAKALGLRGYSRMTKPELVNAIADATV